MFVDSSNTIINRLSAIGIIGNVLLTVFKLIAGILGNSSAMISDAIHSSSDMVATAFAYVGAKVGHKVADESHPFGHERIECIFTMAISLILLGTGLFIGYEALLKITSGTYDTKPEMIAIVAAIISIVVKELMFHYTMHYAKILDSDAFKADAWHHRSDALSSIGAAIGIGGAIWLGDRWTVLDPIASIVVGAMLVKVAWGLLGPSFGELTDKSLPVETEKQMLSLIQEVEGVHDPHHLRTRRVGKCIAAEVHIRLDGNMSLYQAHEIASEVERRFRNRFGEGAYIIVHMEPQSSSS